MLFPNTIVEADISTILTAPLPWEMFDGTSVLVAGAAGLLPAYMVEVLMAMEAQKGFGPKRVVGLARNEQRARERFRHFSARDDFSLIEGDVLRPPSIEGPIDVVIHAASIANARQMAEDPAGTIASNTLGTYNMLELARNRGSRSFLFFSSGEVCGQPGPDQIPMREDVYSPIDPADARACYAEGKRVGETMCAAWSKQFGLQTRIVRPFHTYGPGMNLAGGWIYSDFINDIRAGRDLVIKSDGRGTRSFCYVSDAVEAYFTVMLLGQNALPYNVGTEQETSIIDLARLLAAEFVDLELRVVVNGTPSSAPPKRSVPDLTRLKSLGWRSRTSIAEGFRRTVASLEQAAPQLV